MRRRDVRIAVLGAGIVGAACADAFAAEDFDVVIVERHVVGGGATAAGMGHIVVMDDSPAEFDLTHYSQRLWAELAPSLPSTCEVAVCGTIWVAADGEEMTEVHRKYGVYRQRGVRAEILDDGSLYASEPNLRCGLAGGLRVPDDGVVYPPAAAAWLIERAVARGATLRVGAEVTALSGAKATLADGSHLEADVVVVATGSWAPPLLPDLPIRPRKGHLVITDRYPGYVRHQLVELGYLKSAHSVEADSVAFNVQPRPTGQILIGSSRQFATSSRDVEHQIVGQMLRRAIDYLPGLAQLTTTRIWTGFRAATPDKLPLIGPHPLHQGVLLATGHEGLGITTSLATARLLVDHVVGRTTAIPIDPYLASRFLDGASHG